MHERFKTCPKCLRSGNVLLMFGLRGPTGRERAQSYCYGCRSSKEKPKTIYFTSRESLTFSYRHWYPRDKNGGKRSINFMLGKIRRNTGVNYDILPEQKPSNITIATAKNP